MDDRALSLVERVGPSVEVTLAEHATFTEWHAEVAQRTRFGLCFNTLGDKCRTALRGEVTHARDHGLARGVGVDVSHERDIELHEVRMKFQNVIQTRVARAGVIDRQLTVTHRRERPPNSGVVLYLRVLGHFDDELSLDTAHHVRRVPVDQSRGREVNAQPDVVRQLLRRVECAECAERLQLAPEPHAVGLHESMFGSHAVVESRECFVAHDASRS